jgi:hypothetical protein
MPPRSYFLGCLIDLCWLGFFVRVQKMDLNQLSPELDIGFIDLEAAEPTLFTQKESAVAFGGSNDQQLGPCASNNVDVTDVHPQVVDNSKLVTVSMLLQLPCLLKKKDCMV